MNPHRTRYPDIHEAAGRPLTLPRDLKNFAANDDERDAFGMFRFFARLAIAFVLAFALILVAFSLPEDVPATVPSAEYGRAPR